MWQLYHPGLRRLDRHWLLNQPVLWIMRIHWMVYWWLLGLGLICLVALVLPISLKSVTFLNIYFVTIFLLACLSLMPWIIRQVLFASQLRKNSQARVAVYLLAGYLGIGSIYLAWPYAFVGILESRISSMISEDTLRRDAATFETMRDAFIRDHPLVTAHPDARGERILDNRRPGVLGERDTTLLPPEWRKNLGSLQRLRWKYQSDHYAVSRLTTWSDGMVIVFDSTRVLDELPFIKGFGKGTDPRAYNGWRAILILGTAVLLLALILRVFQGTDIGGLAVSLLFWMIVSVTLVLYDAFGWPLWGDVLSGALIIIFLTGGTVSLYAPRLKRRNALVEMSMNVFILLLAWVPLLMHIFSKQASHSLSWKYSSYYGKIEFFYFLLGVVFLFVLTPWIHRRNMVLQAKPLSD